MGSARKIGYEGVGMSGRWFASPELGVWAGRLLVPFVYWQGEPPTLVG